MVMPYTYGALFAGIGGMCRGFLDAGFSQAFSVDIDPGAAEAHKLICGEPCTVADLATMLPHELRALSPRRPDVLITSPPCKAFSGCLPRATSLTDKYLGYSSLTERGILLALEAWPEAPPPLIVLENVPTISTRGRAWLDAIAKMLNAYGYAVRESTHDCGEIGGLAQRRRRFLLVARHRDSVPGLLYEPHKQARRGIGEVLGALPIPVPGSDAGGPMHRLPQLSALNALRLALIPAGGDWRDLPAEVQLVCSPRSGVFGVSGWEDTSCCVVGAAGHDNGRYAVADPRVLAPRREGSMGVVGWDGITHAVIGCASLQNTALNAADPRLALAQATHWITSDGRLVGHTQLALDARRCMVIILAADGTWHRPMTTLELAALQGFDVGDALRGWLTLPGRSQARHREWIGNAVPPAAAAEIALQCLLTLNAAKTGGFRLVSSLQKPWVAPPQLAA